MYLESLLLYIKHEINIACSNSNEIDMKIRVPQGQKKGYILFFIQVITNIQVLEYYLSMLSVGFHPLVLRPIRVTSR